MSHIQLQVRISSVSSMKQPTWKMQACAWPVAKFRTSWFQNHVKSWMFYFFINLLNLILSKVQSNLIRFFGLLWSYSKVKQQHYYNKKSYKKSIFKKQKFVFLLPSQLGVGGGGTTPVESVEFPPTSSVFPFPLCFKES